MSAFTEHTTLAFALLFMVLLAFGALLVFVFKMATKMRTERRAATLAAFDAEAQLPKPAVLTTSSSSPFIKPTTLHALAAATRRIALRKAAAALPDPEAQTQTPLSPPLSASPSAEKPAPAPAPEPETPAVPLITVTAPPDDEAPIFAHAPATQLAFLSGSPCPAAAAADEPALSPSASLLSEHWVRSSASAASGLAALAHAGFVSDAEEDAWLASAFVSDAEEAEWLASAGAAPLSLAPAPARPFAPARRSRYEMYCLDGDCGPAPEVYQSLVYPSDENLNAHTTSAFPLPSLAVEWSPQEPTSALSPLSSSSLFHTALTSSASFCELPLIDDPVWAFPAPPLDASARYSDDAADFDLAPPARLVDPASAPPASPPRTPKLSLAPSLSAPSAPSPLWGSFTPKRPSPYLADIVEEDEEQEQDAIPAFWSMKEASLCPASPSSPSSTSFAPSLLWSSLTPRRQSSFLGDIVEEDEEEQEMPVFCATKEAHFSAHRTAPPALGLGLVCSRGLGAGGLPTPPPSPVEPAAALCADAYA